MHGLDVRLTKYDWRARDLASGGRLRWTGHPSSPEELCAAVESGDGDAISRIGGHWAAIHERDGDIVLIQDSVRSFPVFYSFDGTPTISDDIEVARAAAGHPDRSSGAVDEFLHLGYVTGADTLFTGISQVQMGERVTLDSNAVRERAFARTIAHDSPGITDEALLDERFDAALGTALDRAFEWIGDRQVVLPLSGGLDSRLLAVLLAQRGVGNVLNFTYGVGETREVGISRTVSESLGQRWEFVGYTPDELRRAWASPEAAEFIRDSYAGASLPHVQDWYAITRLRERGLLSDDAVFLPGHTIVGNMHDERVLDEPGTVSRERLLDLLVHHHSSIRPRSEALLKNAGFLEKAAGFLDRVGYDGSPVSRLDALEGWNLMERQTKYINHSMRGYEHFGYAWALPMLDVELYDVWDAFDLSVAKDRAWYARYVARRYAAAVGAELDTFQGFAAANVSQSNRDLAKSVLRAVGLLNRAEREVVARSVANHPMGFQALVGPTTPAELRRYVLKGGTPMGVWAERFLDDTWNPGTGIFRAPAVSD